MRQGDRRGFRLAWRAAAGEGRQTPNIVRDTSAQAMVEFALIAPLLFIIIFGIMELALMFNAFQQVHYAAFVATRSAIVHIPAAYPKGPDEDREDPGLMAQSGSKTPKKDAMELAAEIAMMPVSPPISSVVATGIDQLPNLLSNLDSQFNQLLSDLGLGGGSGGDLPFADFFNGLTNLGDLQSLANSIGNALGGGGLGNILQGLLGSAAPRDGLGRMYARLNLGNILERGAPGAREAWALGGGGGGVAAPNVPGIRQVQVGEMDVPSELGIGDVLLRSADKLVTSMLATKARAVNPDTHEPLGDDFLYKPGEPLTIRVTYYYSPKMPVVRKLFWKAYLWIKLRGVVHEYLESSGIAGALPEAAATALEKGITQALTNFLGGIDLPYYPIPIHAEATLPIEGNRWCGAVSRDPAPQAGPGANEPCPY